MHSLRFRCPSPWPLRSPAPPWHRRRCLPDLIEPVYLVHMVLFLASDAAAVRGANNYMVEAGSI